MPAHIKYPIVDGIKECGDCGLWKPVSEYKKARNYYTSRCKDCLKIYSAKYRKRPEVITKTKLYHIEYVKDTTHRARINERQRYYNKTDKYKKQRNENRRDWSSREKQKAVDYKGGACCICGYNTCIAALDFHHIDPTQKDGYGTGAIKSHWTFEKNKLEIDKCILVCVRCHREIHAGLHKEFII